MVRTKGTTPKAQLQLQLHFKIKQQQQGSSTTINNNGGDRSESSFRLLYYGDASAGSVPFMWESHPGTPKPSPTGSYLHRPPLTPPPSFSHQNTTSLRTLFLDSSFRKSHVEAAPPPSNSSVNSSDSSSHHSRTSLRSLFLASSSRKSHVAPPPPPVYCSLPSTPMRSKGYGKMGFRRRRAGVAVKEKHVGGGGGDGGGDGSPAVRLCFGGGGLLMRVCRIKKVKSALMAIGGPWRETDGVI